jgi:hypothetical protein
LLLPSSFDDPHILPVANRPQGDPALVFFDPEVVHGTHVLIVGVSAYPNLPDRTQSLTAAGLGMRRLSSTALSALDVLQRLLEENTAGRLQHPLASCRLLLSPTAQEMATRPVIAQLSPPSADTSNFIDAANAWRDAAKNDALGATFYYFAGHGIQRSRGDQVLLLERFGQAGRPLLAHAVDMVTLRNGMAPSPGFPNIARTQLYFVDACRNLPVQILNFETLQTTPVFDVTLSTLDDRRAPIFYASVPDGKAGAIPDEGTLFSRALLACLGGAAGQPPDDGAAETRATTDWHITYGSLHEALTWHMDTLNRQFGWQQTLIADGFTRDTVVSYLPGSPQVPVKIEVSPDAALSVTSINLVPIDGGIVAPLSIPAGAIPHPFDLTIVAGVYMINAIVSPPTPPFQNRARSFNVLPPFKLCRMGVQP